VPAGPQPFHPSTFIGRLWLDEAPEPGRTPAEKASLHDVVEVNGQKIKMKHHPERLMVES